MRRTAAIETSLAMLLAFLLAPFQHVHPEHDHDGHFGEVHAHFFVVHAHAGHRLPGGIQIDADDDDDHAHARSVDTYTLVLPDGPSALPPSPVTIIQPAETSAVPPPEFIEARANSPPPVDQSAPRAPPL